MGKLKSFDQRLYLTTYWNTLLTDTIRDSSNIKGQLKSIS